MMETYGMSFREKMNKTKLEVAMNLLADPKNSIAQISQTLGYSNPPAFSTFIKKTTGKTPIQIRHELLNSDEI